MTYKDMFEADFSKGILFNIKTKRVVGTKDAYGYLIVSFNNKLKKVHRILWEMKFGEIPNGFVIDHINRDVSDNRISNLRLATKSLNAFNAKNRSDNKTKTRGVCFKKDKGKYKAYITYMGKQKHLGYFETIEKAAQARFKEEKENPLYMGSNC